MPPGKRVCSAQPVGAVMIARNDYYGSRASTGQPFHRFEEEYFGFGRRIIRIEHVTCHEDELNLLIIGNSAQLIDELALLI